MKLHLSAIKEFEQLIQPKDMVAITWNGSVYLLTKEQYCELCSKGYIERSETVLVSRI